MKRLLIGPAGSGKTHQLLDEFEASLRSLPDPLEPGLLYLLPSAEHAERVTNLMLQRKIDGFFHRRITTFSKIMMELFGPGESAATNVTRYLILRDLLAGEGWDYFTRVKQSPGFVNTMLGFFSELKESLLDAETFRQRMNIMKPLEPELAAKYETLAGLFEVYEKTLAERGLRDREDLMRDAARRASQSAGESPRFKRIWLDGFFDFSELQFACLEGLCAQASEVTVALTLDPNPARASLFQGPGQFRDRLLALGFKAEFLKPRVRSSTPGVLKTIERGLFSEKPSAAPAAAGEELLCFEAVGVEGEVEMIARHIDRAQRSGHYRFSDFAILLRTIGSYEDVIRFVFGRYGIPLEIHERERLEFAPLVRVVARLVRLFREDWKRTDLMAVLKSTYVRRLGSEDNSLEWVSRLEHFAMRRRIAAGRERWLEALAAAQAGELDHGSALRFSILTGWEDRLRLAASFTVLKGIFLEMIGSLFNVESGGGLVTEAVRRDGASLRRIDAILDEIELSIGRMQKPEGAAADIFDEFADRFLRLVELDLYSLRGGDANRVQVYDISLAREKDYRVVFLAGLLERKFPLQMREDPVLSDWERRLFNGSETSKPLLRERLERQAMERYLFYLACTRATETLVLSYPRIDLEGKEYLPSYYVDETLRLFKPGSVRVERQELARPFVRPADAATRRELELSVLGALVHENHDQALLPEALSAGRILLTEPFAENRFTRAFYRVQDALTDARIHEKDWFSSTRLSPSRLEEYGRCAFMYYSHRVLGLQDPEEDRNVLVRGTILHLALEKFFERWAKNPLLFKDHSRSLQFARKDFEEAMAASELVFEKRYQYELEEEVLWDKLRLFVNEELARLKEAQLVPRYFEYGFGGKGDADPALKIQDGAHLIEVQGRVDRIDVSRDGKCGIVVDYKSGKTFEKKSLELGVQLQLPLYMLAARKYLGLQMVGAELYSIRGRKKNGIYHELGAALAGKGSRAYVLAATDFEALLERSLYFIRKFSQGMRDQAIAVRPRVCESYCSFAPVCRVEKWRLPAVEAEILAEDALVVPPLPERMQAAAGMSRGNS